MKEKKKEAYYRVSVLLTAKERRTLRRALDVLGGEKDYISFNAYFRAQAMTTIAAQIRKEGT